MKRVHVLSLILLAVIAWVAGPRLLGTDLRLPISDEQAGNMLDMIAQDDPRPTWAGSYLAAQFAQENFDWARASTFLSQVRNQSPHDAKLQKRALVIALNAGDIGTALNLAQRIPVIDDETGIARLVLLLEDIRQNNLTAARARLAALPASPLMNFPRPVINAWLAEPLPNPQNLLNQDAYFAHVAMMGDYTKNLAGAEQMAKNARLIDSLNVANALHIGDIFLRHQKYDLAEQVFDRMVKAHADQPHLQERIQSAKTHQILPGLSLTPPPHSIATGVSLVFYDMAGAFYSESSYDTAQLFAQLALMLDPNLSEAQLLIADTLAGSNRTDAAIATYRKIQSSNARYVQIQMEIANLQTEQNQIDSAIATLETALASATEKEDKIALLLQMGDIYRSNDQFEAAIEKYNQAAEILDNKIDAPHWQLLYARGMTYERLKQWDKAEADLTAALGFRPNHPFILNYLGYSWADQGIRLDDAAKFLEQAVKLIPDDGYITDSVGWVYFRMKKYEQAVSYLERAVELLPYDATINDHLGDAYAAVGRMREAKFQWQRAYNYAEDEIQKDQLAKKLGLTVEVTGTAKPRTPAN
jgi:tetratricopeptide (TPR) repeat protein